MTDNYCPMCGTPVRIVGSDEGTMHYEPCAPIDVKRLATALMNDDDNRLDHPGGRLWIEAATDIAREYAALAMEETGITQITRISTGDPEKDDLRATRLDLLDICAEQAATIAALRAALDAVDVMRVLFMAETRRRNDGEYDLWVAEMLTAAARAVDAAALATAKEAGG